jgi:SMI1 / KNR4 family (SUKH-1)
MSDEAEDQLIARLDRIADKLDRLREADRAFSVFGSDSHGYLLGSKLTERDLLAVEQRLGVRLPKEYRLFLARLGEGGAGPFYGLFTPYGEDLEDITNPEYVRKPFRWSEAFNPYHWNDACSQEDVWCDDPEENGNPQIILHVPGALYICHFGCAIRFFLIVNGQCFGEVWRDSQADEGGILPECGDDGCHLAFLDWYERWLDDAISAR